jgi:hypothetical protein
MERLEEEGEAGGEVYIDEETSDFWRKSPI